VQEASCNASLKKLLDASGASAESAQRTPDHL
jgi:hypothetical protein